MIPMRPGQAHAPYKAISHKEGWVYGYYCSDNFDNLTVGKSYLLTKNGKIEIYDGLVCEYVGQLLNGEPVYTYDVLAQFRNGGKIIEELDTVTFNNRTLSFECGEFDMKTVFYGKVDGYIGVLRNELDYAVK